MTSELQRVVSLLHNYINYHIEDILRIFRSSKNIIFFWLIYHLPSKYINIDKKFALLRNYTTLYWIRFEWNKRRCTYVHWRIFILVEIWIHCCTRLNWTLELNMHWKNAGLYTLATKDWEMWELLLGANWQVRVNRITIAWETVTWEN